MYFLVLTFFHFKVKNVAYRFIGITLRLLGCILVIRFSLPSVAALSYSVGGSEANHHQFILNFNLILFVFCF